MWGEAPNSNMFFYLGLVPLLSKINFALQCTGLPSITSSSSSRRDPMEEAAMAAWESLRLFADVHEEPGPMRQKSAASENVGQRSMEQTKGVAHSVAERRRLFLVYDETWPLFRIIRNLFEGLGMPKVYHEIRFAAQSLTNGMSIGAALFFLGCLLGFSCLEIPFYWDAFRLQNNRQAAFPAEHLVMCASQVAHVDSVTYSRSPCNNTLQEREESASLASCLFLGFQSRDSSAQCHHGNRGCPSFRLHHWPPARVSPRCGFGLRFARMGIQRIGNFSVGLEQYISRSDAMYPTCPGIHGAVLVFLRSRR